MLRGSGFSDIVMEASICASGSLEKVLSGKHYNRALRVHKIVIEALERLLLRVFQERDDQILNLSLLESLTNEALDANLRDVLESDQFHDYFERYQTFKEGVRRGVWAKLLGFGFRFKILISYSNSSFSLRLQKRMIRNHTLVFCMICAPCSLHLIMLSTPDRHLFI